MEIEPKTAGGRARRIAREPEPYTARASDTGPEHEIRIGSLHNFTVSVPPLIQRAETQQRTRDGLRDLSNKLYQCKPIAL